MDRQDLIKEEGNRIMQPVLRRSMAEMMNQYKRDEKEILDGFQKALEELYLAAGKSQLCGKKGTLSYLGICYCLSSAYTGNYELRMDLYDEDFYLDENVCCVYWNPGFHVPFLREDIACFHREIRQKIPRVKAYEEQQFIVEYMRNYMYSIWEFLKQKMYEVLDRINLDGMEVAGDFHIFFGEYMGRCVIIDLHKGVRA